VSDALNATDPLAGPFLWGTATSAYQVEAENDRSDWAAFGRPPAGAACDFLAHAEADLDRAAALGTNAFRLSLEWSRIEPRPGERDPAAVDAYRRVLAACRARGLRPVVTLVQFTLPAWCAPRDRAWLRPEVQEAFARHAAFCGRTFGDLADLWVTLNEPNVQAGAGYVAGVFPPGRRLRQGLADRCQAALLEAHVRAYDALHAGVPGPAAVGVAPHLVRWRPSAWDVGGVVRRAMERFSWGFVEALTTGELRLATLRRAVPWVEGKLDFLGLSYFCGFPATVPGALRFAGLLARPARPGTSDMGWPIDAAGFEDVLVEASRRAAGRPVVVTENGVADAADALRPAYLRDHLAALGRARARGADVRGYLHWSLVDNYEWHEGFAPRFGLFAVDYATQARTPRPSAALYRDLIAAARREEEEIREPVANA